MLFAPHNLTDTHCHLNGEEFAGRVEEVVTEAEMAGIGAIIVPGWNRESSLQALALAAAHPTIHPAVGLHPWFLADDDLAWLPEYLDDPRVVAVGEIGLDGPENAEDAPRQEAIFRRQLQLAVERDLPVLIHCRRGWNRMLQCVKEAGRVRGIIHAFSGSREILRDCVNLGFYISFAGMVTRPHSYRAHEATTLVPADRLLLETDAPCMALEGVPVGQSAPIHLLQVLQYVADLRGETPEALAAQAARNVIALFGE